MTTYFMMASLTLLVVLTWTLHTASFTLYQQEETNYQMTPVSHPEYESASKCVEDERKRFANCRNLELREVPDYLSPNIQKLDLRFNKIENLFDSSFFRYRQLTQLDISWNSIRNIEGATFQPLEYLVDLHLFNNENLLHLHPNILKSNHRLSVISVGGCGLTSFPQNVQHFKQLRSLILGGNAITHIQIKCHPEIQVNRISLRNNNFKELTQQTFILDCDVNVLDLSLNAIKSIDPYTIASLRVHSLVFNSCSSTYAVGAEVYHELFSKVAMSNIKYLSLACLKKNVSSPHFFSPLHNYSFSTLDLSDAEIGDDIDTIFDGLYLLLELTATLVHPGIPNLEPTYFSGMNALQILNLENNDIEHINPSNSTWRVVSLRELYLCTNKFEFITQGSFQGLSNLSLLDLAYNENLFVIHPKAFLGLNLQYLNVSYTRLLAIRFISPLLISITAQSVSKAYFQPEFTFRQSQSLEMLDLTDSKLWNDEIWLNNISLFHGLSNLTKLSLKHNLISELVTGVFQGLSALEFLDISHGQIRSIKANTFRGLISLRFLSLEQNSIQHIPVNLFIDLKHLLICNLMKNNLNYLDGQTFANTTSLKTLLLAVNHFTDFNRSIFQPTLALAIRSVDISQNPLICNCELTWLVEWLKGPVDVLNVAVCSTGTGTLAPWRGKPLLTFNPNELCGPNILLVSLVPLAAIGLIATLFVVYHYRWYVRFKLYLLKLAVLGYEEVLDAREHGDFEFDLNIMFLEDDAQWVVEYLTPVLEERLPNFNRNAIGDGDLILGMHYLDAVYYVIEKSFKTVILLSRAAVKENWFMIKFRIAFEHVNDDRMENVVLVFLEDIPDAEIPFLVRLYLSERRTYLEWVEDERGQEYFWEELILTLQRDNARWNNVIPPE